MANIIPEDLRGDMRSRSRARYILTGSVIAIMCAVLCFLTLLPSYFVLVTNTSGATSTAAALAIASGYASDKATVTHTRTLLSALIPLVSATSTPTSAISAALSASPSGVRIDQITYTAGVGSTPSSLMLVGSANTTSEISAYRAALAGDPLFISVSVPVSALVGTDGGRFSVTLSGKF